MLRQTHTPASRRRGKAARQRLGVKAALCGFVPLLLLLVAGCGAHEKSAAPPAPDKATKKFWSLVGADIVAADDFRRSDQASLEDSEQTTPVGQLQWQPTRDASLHPLVDGRYAPTVSPQEAAYARLFVPGGYDAIGGQFVMVRDGSTRGQSAVIGSGANTFGTNGDGGSIQLAVWDKPIMYSPHVKVPGQPDIVLPPRPIQWLAFQVEDPVEDPYPPVYDDLAGWLNGPRNPDALRGAYGLFKKGFTLEAGTEYVEIMRRTGAETVEVELPDGQVHAFDDPEAVGRWGVMGAIQTRRSADTDGTVEWTGVAFARSADGHSTSSSGSP